MITNTWKMLDTERGISFLRYTRKHSIHEGKRLAWNNHMIEKMLPHFEKKRIAIDVGANYGFVSNELATEFNVVISSEIIPEVRACLKENMQHNKNVKIIETGLYNYTGKHQILFSPTMTGHTGSNTLKEAKNIQLESRLCAVTTLDKLVGDRDDIDFIKIDVEGEEFKVLEGATKTLKNSNPLVLIEMHSNSIVKNDLMNIEILWNNDYRFIARYGHDYLFKKKKQKI